MVHGFYVHVPFCVRKCGYCDFYSIPQPGATAGSIGRAASPDAARYLAALERELDATVPRDFRARTVFIGGGTPTELGQEDFEEAGAALAPGTSAAILIWENTWAAPVAVALRKSGGQLVASGRIPVQAIIAALDELETVQ